MSAFDDYLNAPAAQAAPSFDSYLGAAPVSAASTSTAQPPVVQGSQPGMLASFGAGLGHGVQSAALGTQQLLGRGAQAVGMNSIGNWLTNDVEQGLARGNVDYAPYSAAHPVVAGAGNIGGQIAGTAPTMLLGPEYAGLSLAGKVGLGAAQGAAGASMMPVQNPGNDFWTQKAEQAGTGGLLGAATPAVAAGAKAVGSGLWNAVQPVVQPGRFVGQGLANAMDPAEAALAAQNIRGAQQFVPGSMPTTAQAAQTPVMVQTEKAAGNIPAFKTGMLQRGIDNNDARWQSLMGVAQDPAALDAATQARTAMAQPMYDAAHQATANVGPAFMKYAQIPEMQEAMQRAHDTAALDAAVGRGVPPVWPTPAVPGGAPASKAINGAALDYTSRALGDMINDAQHTGATTRAGSLTALKTNVDSWMGQYIPGVQQARQAYAQASVPINTMDVGQQIANGLGTRAMNAGGAPEIQMMPFRSALTKATGSGDAAKFGIDANALQQLQGIGQDLQRATVSNSIRSPGSDTAYNLAANGWLAKQLYGPTFGGAGSAGKAIGALGAAALGHPWVGAGILTGGNKIGQMVGGRLQDRLSGLLLNSDTALPFLDSRAASAAQGIPGPLMQGLLNYGRPAAVNGLLGGFQNPGN
ncbi:hypothetical protein [Paraburkholderia sediminicola]|uniref:hypothetical protein n=1 Tax=Paraburkholderia sediminicola TaxID=458836 RepID=UPI0038BB9A06